MDVDVLYYPKIEPPDGWLRQMLLLVNSVSRYVPDDEDLQDSMPYQRLRDELPPETLRDRRAQPQELQLAPPELAALDAVCKRIAEEGTPVRDSRSGRVVKLEDVGVVTSAGYYWVHEGKMAEKAFRVLETYGLAGSRRDNIARNLDPRYRHLGPEWRSVERRAADILIAYAADRAARSGGKEPLRTATDEHLAYAATVLTGLTGGASLDRRSALLGAMVEAFVPANLQGLTPGEFVKMRDRYEDLRHSLGTLLARLDALNDLEQAGDPETLVLRAQHAVAKFTEECEKYKKSWARRLMGPVMSVSLGGIVGAVGSIGGPPLGAAAGAVGAGAGVLLTNRALGAPEHWRTFRLLCKVRKDALTRGTIPEVLSIVS